MPCAAPSHAQTNDPILPADLLFTIPTAWATYNSLVRVDAETLQASTFYMDDSISLQALSWSPSGDLLAILRMPTDEYLEVCLLTQEGVLQTCLEDRIASYTFLEQGQNYMVTWSEDERYIYFVTDYDQFRWDEFNSDYWGASLVKADVVTGQTEQILYQTQVRAHYPPPHLSWTNDLHFLLLYDVGEDTPTGVKWGSTMIDLWQNAEVTHPQAIPGLGVLKYCPQFSAHGSYLIARAYLDDVLAGLTVTLPDGQIIHTVGRDRLQEAGIEWIDCPVWQSDEAAFYFLGGMNNEARLFKYVLGDDAILTVEQLYRPEPQDSQLFPEEIVSLAPDDTTLAIRFYIPYGRETHILLSTHEWLTFDEGYIGLDPLWFPTEN
jgi:hypothetical protein